MDVAGESEHRSSESLISRKGTVERVIQRLLQMAVGYVTPFVSHFDPARSGQAASPAARMSETLSESSCIGCLRAG